MPDAPAPRSNTGPTLAFCRFLTWCTIPCACYEKPHMKRQKVVRACGFFVHVDLEMCFAPQRCALFSTSQLKKVVRTCGAFSFLIWKCASRHNGVQFFISHLARWLRTRRFSEPTFRPSRATNHWKKHSESRLSYLFAHLHLLSSHSFSSLLFSLLGFSSLTLPTSAFPSVHIVGGLT